MNFSEICVRNESEGTETNSFLHLFEIRVANIVSVLPVPVGITTIPLSSGFCKWLKIEYKAPIWGGRKPFILFASSS